MRRMHGDEINSVGYLTSLRLCLLAMLFGCLIFSKPLLAKGVESVKLIAPDTVREVIEQHFMLPELLLENENERAIFMRRAQREIPELLMTEGYFSSTVVLRSVSKAGVLDLEVIPGERTVVTAVKIEFLGDLALPDGARTERVQQLRSGWTLQPGKPFRSATWEDAKSDLLARVSALDYATARLVGTSAEVDKVKAGANLHIVVDSGPRFLFGDMQVSGLERYDELLVSRYATFTHSQPYQRDLLLSFQRKLQNLPQFSSVIVTLETGQEVSDEDTVQEVLTVPVKVQVVEAKSRKLSLGVGYSTNNGVRQEVNYQSYNFLNQAWILNSAVVAEQNRQTVSAKLDTPPNPSGYHFSWFGSGEKTQIQGLETLRDKFGVIRSRTRENIETGIGISWQQEQRLPLGGIREIDQALVLDGSLNRRTVDNPLFPTSGALTDVRIGVASKAMLSDQDFVRNYLRQQIWIPLGASNVVTLRVEGGYTAADSSRGIPQEYLFRAGGTQTVRGFAYQSLGIQEGNAIVGGRVMATGSAEFTHWFGNWGGAVFFDAGGVADKSVDLHLSQGYGFGPRWRSPVGPLALDYARGKGEPDSRIHFSIAVAF